MKSLLITLLLATTATATPIPISGDGNAFVRVGKEETRPPFSYSGTVDLDAGELLLNLTMADPLYEMVDQTLEFASHQYIEQDWTANGETHSGYLLQTGAAVISVYRFTLQTHATIEGTLYSLTWNDIFYRPEAVPEPSTLWLLVMGPISLFLRLRLL